MPVSNFVWDVESDNYLMETDETDTATAVYTHEPVQFGGLISQLRNGTSSTYHFDVVGSTRELSNSIAGVTDTYLYDTWGMQLASIGASDNPFRYLGESGHYWDQDVENYYVKVRRYRPHTARWDSGAIDGLNSYLFMDNRPTSDGDPLGLLSSAGLIIVIPPVFPGPRAESTLPCSGLADHFVCCSGDICSFSLSTFYVPLRLSDNSTGLFAFGLSIRHYPGTPSLVGLPPSERRQFRVICQSDVGRVSGVQDHLTVTLLDGTECRFIGDHFSETGQLKENPPGLSEACQKALSVTGDFELGRPPYGRGQSINTTQPVKSVKFRFTIETFCGCGGSDNLGRPNERLSGTLTLEGMVP